MAAMMASTLAGSRPSEKLGTHSTSVDISGKDSWRRSREAREPGLLMGHYCSGTTGLARIVGLISHKQPVAWQSAFPLETGQIITGATTSLPAGLLLAVGNIYSLTLTATMSNGERPRPKQHRRCTRWGLGSGSESGTAHGPLFGPRWLLLRHAVHCAQPPYEVSGINGHYRPSREEFSQSVQDNAVIRVVEYGREYDAVGDVEICVAGWEPSPFKHNRLGHWEFDNVEGLAVLIARGFESAEIVAERLVVLIFRMGLNPGDGSVGRDEAAEVVDVSVSVVATDAGA